MRLPDSRIKTENVSRSETILGYLVGPSLSFLITTGVAGNYLIQFYTDVIGLSGAIIVLMPFISKILMAILNVLFGKIMDKSCSVQGKGRPWVLLSGVLLGISGILLYAVPKASYGLQIVWIIFTYNLFFAFANNIYLLGHNLLFPRSTRETKDRDKLSLVKNLAEAIIPGILSAVVMPLLIKNFGVGAIAQSNWFRFMLILSCFAVPAGLIEYFFTKERVTDDTLRQAFPFRKQMKDCFGHKRWVLVMALFAIRAVDNYVFQSTMIYYCNWVLADSVAAGAAKQVILNVIGQAPMGIGLLVLWPLVRKAGKLRLMKWGYLLSALGCLIALLSPNNLALVLVGIMIKSIGGLPSYLSMSLLSDAIDDFEQSFSYRCDTFSMSVYTVLATLCLGIAQTVLLTGINLFGYIAPESSEQVVQQLPAVTGFFNISMNGIPLALSLVGFVLVSVLIGQNKKQV